MCDPSLVTPTIKAIQDLSPTSLLEVGVGVGKWGVLVREYVDGWNHGKRSKDSWQTKIYGLELKPGSRVPSWDVYNAVFPGTAKRTHPAAIDHFGPFDLALIINVLEDLSASDATELLRNIMFASQNVLVGFSKNRPKNIPPALTQWSKEILSELPFKLVEEAPDQSWGLYLFTEKKDGIRPL